MYTYLNQKYGLKSLIVDWASTIIQGVKTYIKEDHEVTLFGKVLKNECDEEFRFIQLHVKETLQNLLKILLREKFHLKTEGEISGLIDTIQQGTIEDWQWKKIINKMYDREDVEILMERFRECIECRKQRKENNNTIQQSHRMNTASQTRKISRDEETLKKRFQKKDTKLMYSEFLKVILDFQLQEHEKFLFKFTEIFKMVDHDSNGILDENQFRELIRQMGILQFDEDIDALLSIVDPHNNKQMTYSEVVQLLSSQMVPMSEINPQQIPLLEKFVTQFQNDEGNQDLQMVGQQMEEQESEKNYCDYQ